MKSFSDKTLVTTKVRKTSKTKSKAKSKADVPKDNKQSTACCTNEVKDFDSRYPTVEDLRALARKNIPRFCFEYLDGGCNEDRNLRRNTSELRNVTLQPHYLAAKKELSTVADTSTTLFGQKYAAPFGISPMGLQGLLWPGAPQILAKAARLHNLPFVLSTLTTIDIEEAAALAGKNLWFQLYHPNDEKIRDDLLSRADAAGVSVLIIIADVPMHGFRPRDIRNGLAMPPSMSLKNILQMVGRPRWMWNSMTAGVPQFRTLLPYMPKNLDLRELGKFMNSTFNGKLSQEKLKKLRNKWKGKLVVKGLATEADCEIALKLGVDGVIVSNHGGRQLDLGESAVAPMARIVKKFGKKMPIMIDSGVRAGTDVAAAMALGSSFVFLGRSFMYSVAALGDAGGEHMASLLKAQFFQIMEQLRCKQVKDMPKHLYKH